MRRWLFWVKPGILPIAIGASVLLIAWFYLLWNTTAGQVCPQIRFRTKATIAGIVQEAAPVLSLNAVLSGAYQQWISKSIGQLSPVFKPAIRLKGWIYYDLLGMAPAFHIVVGRNHELIEKAYLDEYCNRNLAALRPAAENWATRIRGMQDFFAAHGKPFVYIITPSKAAEQPDVIPDDYVCPASAADRTKKLAVYDGVLAQHGVRFIDTASRLIAAREEYGVDMFPRGGLHWNLLAATLGAQKVIAAVNTQEHAPVLGRLDFKWHISYYPQGSDRDLLDLLNIRHPDSHYPVPELTYESQPASDGCHTVNITEVGGSFLGNLNTALGKLACPPRIDEWFYWDDKHLQFAGDRLYDLPMDAGARRQALLEADVIFFEENEEVGPQSVHGEKMLAEMEKLARGVR
jgi:alginate O-acetyltransferase complex protein AlgJ